MGKTIVQQARGRGGPAYRVRRRAFRYRITYPPINVDGKAMIRKLINSPAHTSPLAEIKINEHLFIVPAAEGIFEGGEIHIGNRPDAKKFETGDIMRLKDIPQGTRIYNIEKVPGKGGVFLRTAGTFGTVTTKDPGVVEILIKRRQIRLPEDARAIIGVPAGDGRKLKPIVKAGKKHYMMKAIGRKWHYTSDVKVNAVDHPFGGGRGKRIKSKIAQRDAPAGAKVGHLRPKRTGRKK